MNSAQSDSPGCCTREVTNDGLSQETAGGLDSERGPRPEQRLSTRWELGLTAILSSIAILDQITKLVVVESIPLGTQRVVIPHFFSLVHFRNTGAAWGILQGRSALLAVLSAVVFAFIIWQIHRLTEGYAERIIALALVLGGITGNFIDRLLRGEVVDFLHVYYRGFSWPAFNVADSAICCGVALFIASSLFRDSPDNGQDRGGDRHACTDA